MSEQVKPTAFTIEHAEEYECYVEYYVIGHSELSIQGRHTTRHENFNIIFSGVEFFSGTVRWKSGNFTISSDEECLSLLRKIERFKGDDEQIRLILQYYKLYRVEMPNYTIEILARGSSIKKTVSKD